MRIYNESFNWIDRQQESMCALLEEWSCVNSGSHNLPGLGIMCALLKKEFSSLGGQLAEIPLPSFLNMEASGQLVETPVGHALHVRKHPNAPIQVFLAGHMDTVFSSSNSFQNTTWIDHKTLRGPGVADMKGGLIVLLTALQALESSPLAGKLGWDVLINPDEEIGSVSSTPIFLEIAKRHRIGLIFEPAFPDGALVSSRKGSATFSIITRGRPAHVGRDFSQGRNAIASLARLISKIEGLIDPSKGLSINIGAITGGGPINIVPDFAIGHFNARMQAMADHKAMMAAIRGYIDEENAKEGFFAELHEVRERNPKPITKSTEQLFNCLETCAKDLNVPILTRPSGGVCDGNTLAGAGLAVIDTLGVVGGNLHTPEEYVQVQSLSERARLAASLLFSLAAGEIDYTQFKKETL